MNNKAARRSDETLDKSDATPSANNAFDLVQCGIPAQYKVIVHHQTLPDSHKKEGRENPSKIMVVR